MAPKKQDPAIRFWKHVEKTPACWNWIGARMWAGYGVFNVARDRKYVRAHRYAWEMSNGKVPDGLCVLHRCDNRSCVRSDHLFVGTAHDNVRDMIEKSRAGWDMLRGERNHNAKLTDDGVRKIRRLGKKGLRHKEIAHLIGMSQATVSYILEGKTWTHVK